LTRVVLLLALAVSGCGGDLGTVEATVEAVEVRPAHGGPRIAAAYSFELDGRRFLDANEVPRRQRRPEVGDTISVRVRSTNPLRTEIASIPPFESRPLTSSSARVEGDSAFMTTPDSSYSIPRTP
jgi:hypothetical protein